MNSALVSAIIIAITCSLSLSLYSIAQQYSARTGFVHVNSLLRRPFVVEQSGYTESDCECTFNKCITLSVVGWNSMCARDESGIKINFCVLNARHLRSSEDDARK